MAALRQMVRKGAATCLGIFLFSSGLRFDLSPTETVRSHLRTVTVHFSFYMKPISNSWDANP